MDTGLEFNETVAHVHDVTTRHGIKLIEEKAPVDAFFGNDSAGLVALSLITVCCALLSDVVAERDWVAGQLAGRYRALAGEHVGTLITAS